MEHTALIERLGKVVSESERQIDRLNRLVDELLDVSRINNGKLTLHFEELNLTELIADVINRFSANLAKVGCMVTFVSPGPVLGSWDRLRIDQVLTNLLTNAAKYGPGKPVEVLLESEDGYARFTVRDQGIGIPFEHHSRIFERFERAVSSSHFGGLGLGLYIVRQILEAHGGTISVESQPGDGSSFSVTVPLNPAVVGLSRAQVSSPTLQALGTDHK